MTEHDSQALRDLSPAKRELLRRLRTSPRRLADEPVAILGVAARLPGAESYGALWPLLCAGKDAIREVPVSRWPVDAVPGGGRYGGFLDHVDRFDADFFAISPREAATMDPQHRLLLESSWHALEDAGLRSDELAGSQTAVFVATYQRDYMALATADAARIDAYTASGTHHSMAAGRLAYVLDLRGPALTIDTACSSSLVALHLATRSLMQRECDLAIVGAANLMFRPEETLALARFGMLAADGRCKSFAAGADGFVRGEGIVTLVLARARDASAQGRRTRALIIGSATNQDGRSNGLTAPSVDAQRAVIRAALRDASITPEQVGHIEAHGTGTALGDPIEMEALVAEYGRPSAMSCAVGSIKSNIGHLEAAAGLAGVAKALACLENSSIPATLHVDALNPAIVLRGSRLEVATHPRRWPDATRRYSAVSSFGMGGTNAHVILAAAEPRARSAGRPRSGLVLPLCAESPSALDELSRATQAALANATDVASYCASAARCRTHTHKHRRALFGASGAELQDAIQRASDAPRHATTHRPEGVVFLCPGQGGQWLGMGRQLLALEPVFAEELTRCDDALRPLTGWSLVNALSDATALDRIDVIQPLIFAMSLGYAALWRSFGVRPSALIGHSMGEVAAHYLGGRIGLDEAAAIIVGRSSLLRAIEGGGAMLTLDRGGAETEGILREFRGGAAGALALAAENGPRSSVVSGPRGALDDLATELDRRGIRWRRIAVSVASHGPAVDPVNAALAARVDELRRRAHGRPSPSQVRQAAVYSTVTGRILDPAAEVGLDYWRRNLRQPVRMWPALQAAVADHHDTFIELGPHPVLLHALRDGLDSLGVRGHLLSSGRRDTAEQLVLCEGLASLYERGAELDWDQVYAEARVDPGCVPLYPFQPVRHWLPAATRRRGSRRRSDAGAHPLLAERIDLADAERQAHVWTTRATLNDVPFVRDHLVEGCYVLPGMASVELVASALTELGCATPELQEVEFERPLVFTEDEAVDLQLRIDGERFALWAKNDGEWIRRVVGRVANTGEVGPVIPLAELRADAHLELDADAFYTAINDRDNLWGPAFRGVAGISRAGETLLVDLVIAPPIRGALARHRFHPALLDACGQALIRGFAGDRGSLVLAKIERIAFSSSGGAERASAAVVRMSSSERDAVCGDVVVVSDAGARLVEIDGLRIQRIHRRPTTWFHALTWIPMALPDVSTPRRDPTLQLEGGAPQLRAAIASSGGSGSARDVVYLVDQAGDPDARDATSTLDACVEECAAVLNVAARLEPEQRLWLVTRGGAPTLAGLEEPLHTAIWGLATVMKTELGRRFGGVIDLEPHADIHRCAATLRAEIACAGVERLIAWRDGARLVARLEPRPSVELTRDSEPLRPDASYLITGGLGGVGPHLARYLIGRGARRLILLGRSPLPERARWGALTQGDPYFERVQAIRGLEAAGAAIHIVPIDIADETALHAWFRGWTTEGRPPIRGIFHAAGVQQPRSLAELDDAGIREGLRAKVGGMQALARVIDIETLDILVAFSSAATLLPSPLLGVYAAANGFLDGFAARARQRGQRALSIAWGLLGVGGMARARAAEGRRMEFLDDMSPGRAFAAMDRLIAQGCGHAAVLAIDWPRWLESHPDTASDPYFEALVQISPSDRPAVARTAREDFAKLAPEVRSEAIRGYIRATLGRILRVPDDGLDALDLRTPLTRFGVDSLTALELRNRVEADTGAAPPVVEMLRGSSLAWLAEFIEAHLAAAEGESEPETTEWEHITI